MDPPPQAHTGVGHDAEYTTAGQAGQLAVTMWTHSDSERTDHREAAPAPASASALAGGPPSTDSAAEYRSAGRTPLSAVTR